MRFLAFIAALLLSSTAYAQGWSSAGTCSGTKNSISNSVGYYCFTDTTNSDIIQIGPGAFSLELNPDIAGTDAGALVTLYRCSGLTEANDCRPYYIDLTGDGIIDEEPFDGVTAGKVGFDIPYFGGRYIYINVTGATTGKTARVKIEAGQ